jgi:hypothetical protein
VIDRSLLTKRNPMADTPVPGGAQRGAIKPPNEVDRGDRRGNGYLPLAEHASECQPPNSPSDRRSGTMPLSGMASPITPPNHRFDVGMAKMPQPGSAETPGKGAVPVNPFTGGVVPLSNKRAK